MVTTVETAVLDRLLDPVSRCLTPEVARRIVKLRADPAAQARVNELARKSSAGQLSPSEQADYDTYIAAGTFIAVLESKARILLAAESIR